MKNYWKKLLLAGLLIFLSVMGYWLSVRYYKLEEIAIDKNLSISISVLQKDYQVKRTKNNIDYEKDNIRIYEVVKNKELVGRLAFEGLKIDDTEDYYYFLRYNPTTNEDIPLQIHVRVKSSSQEVVERHILYPFDQAKQQPILTISNSSWTEPNRIASGYGLPRQAMFLDGEDFSMHLNMVNVYEALGNGVRKEHFDLTLPIHYLADKRKQEFVISFPHIADKEIEHWGMIGKEGMVDWDDEEQKDLLLIANLDWVRKWTWGGVQYVTPETYYPYDPRAFWVVPAQHVGDRLFTRGKNRFATNFANISLQAALDTQTAGGYWVTQPRSIWLYEDYGLDAGFYDTRFSTDAAMFLQKAYRQLGNEVYRQAIVDYGDFLTSFAETHHYKTLNGGYLVFDYTHGEDPNRRTETLTSLNHLITEMNFLYELYKDTNEEKYFQIAEKMRIAVKDTTPYWKKPDGDLWYAYLPDGSYGLQDYPLLTLKDLRYSQQLIEELHGEGDGDFQYLIDVKERYLISKGLPLYD